MGSGVAQEVPSKVEGIVYLNQNHSSSRVQGVGVGLGAGGVLEAWAPAPSRARSSSQPSLDALGQIRLFSACSVLVKSHLQLIVPTNCTPVRLPEQWRSDLMPRLDMGVIGTCIFRDAK